jgi:hypothetical protein
MSAGEQRTGIAGLHRLTLAWAALVLEERLEAEQGEA